VEFLKDKKTEKPFDPSVQFNTRLLDKTLEILVLLSISPQSRLIEGDYGDHVQITQPFIFTPSQVDEIVDIFDQFMTEVEDDLEMK